MACPEAAPPLLFEAVGVIEAGVDWQPKVLFQYSPNGQLIDDNIAAFCFPDAHELASDPGSGVTKLRHTFVLTESSATRKLGCCHRYPHQRGRTALSTVPECVVFLSKQPWPSTFFAVAEVVAQLRCEAVKGGGGADSWKVQLTELLTQLAVLPPDADDGTFSASVTEFEEEDLLSGCSSVAQSRTFHFERPANHSSMSKQDAVMEGVDFLALSSPLGAFGTVEVMEALLGECRVIICGSDLTMLSSAVQAAAGLLHPMTWQHIFVSVLPRKLLDMVCAPMPFLVGVMTPHMQQVEHMPLEAVVIVNLDNGTVKKSQGCTLARFPGRSKLQLSASLEQALGLAREGALDEKRANVAITAAFLKVFVDILGEYRLHVHSNSICGNYFDHDKLVDTSPPDVQQFLKTLLNSQLYKQWVDTRAAAASTASGEQSKLSPFEQAAYEIELAIVAKQAQLGDMEYIEDIETDFDRSSFDTISASLPTTSPQPLAAANSTSPRQRSRTVDAFTSIDSELFRTPVGTRCEDGTHSLHVVMTNGSECLLNLQRSKTNQQWASVPPAQICRASLPVVFAAVSEEMFSGVEGQIVYAVQPPDGQAACSTITFDFDVPVMGANELIVKAPPYLNVRSNWIVKEGDHVQVFVSVMQVEDVFNEMRRRELARHRCNNPQASSLASVPSPAAAPRGRARANTAMPLQQPQVVMGTAIQRDRRAAAEAAPPQRLDPAVVIPSMVECCNLAEEMLNMSDADPSVGESELLIDLKKRCTAFVQQVPQMLESCANDEQMTSELLVANDGLVRLLEQPGMKSLQGESLQHG